MASRLNRTLTEHSQIREWAEQRGAKPACVVGTGNDREPGMLRLDFPGFSGEKKLREITWDEWFRSFDQNGLALIVQDKTAGGDRSNFNKLIARARTESPSGGAARSGHGREGSSNRASGGKARRKSESAKSSQRGKGS